MNDHNIFWFFYYIIYISNIYHMCIVFGHECSSNLSGLLPVKWHGWTTTGDWNEAKVCLNRTHASTSEMQMNTRKTTMDKKQNIFIIEKEKEKKRLPHLVYQHGIRHRNHFETFFRPSVLVLIGMELQRQFPIRHFDVSVGRNRVHT